ncbi:MAG: hypothetical protein J2P50_15105 [Hyphomicrobiaceae bacterium]|nr:hypothetical protein [Hyphomicrobiaceae bacterium]
MRAPVCAVVLVSLLAPLGASGAALSQAACAKADFEAVVNAAGAALRDLAQQNKPVFQAKLNQLKDKRSWSNDELIKQAEPLVRDETIAGYDKKSQELLARITGAGQNKADPPAPNCALLTSLQADLKLLVETQQAKWTRMFGKLDQELAK